MVMLLEDPHEWLGEAGSAGVGLVMPLPAFLSQSPDREGPREDMEIGKAKVVSSFSASEKGLESLFLRLRGYQQLFVAEVPPGCHMERHVG